MNYRISIKSILKIFVNLLLIVTLIGCTTNDNTTPKHSTNTTAENKEIPDTIVQFLMTSAAKDFRNHQPPTPIDFRDIKIGYLTSTNNAKNFILCGEFLSKENKEWIEFATIKTEGYEQYIGKTHYCQEATTVLTDAKLSADLIKMME